MHHMTYLQEAQKGGAGGLPLQKNTRIMAKKGGAGGLPLQKRIKVAKKGGAGGLPLQKRIKIATFGRTNIFLNHRVYPGGARKILGGGSPQGV